MIKERKTACRNQWVSKRVNPHLPITQSHVCTLQNVCDLRKSTQENLSRTKRRGSTGKEWRVGNHSNSAPLEAQLSSGQKTGTSSYAYRQAYQRVDAIIFSQYLSEENFCSFRQIYRKQQSNRGGILPPVVAST
jgi:hypothetical protein